METAFGKWNHYIRECLSFLKRENHKFFYPELLAYYELVETGNKSKKYKGEIEYQDANGDTQIIVQTSITSIGMLINFRNRYLGHGQTLDEDKSKALWSEYYPIFKNLLEQLSFTKDYPMLKREYGETYLLHSSEMTTVESNIVSNSNIWIQNKEGESFDILPFFVVPGEVSLAKDDKEQVLTYESYTGKTIKFFSPEGTEKQTSGKVLDRLNLLLREKQKEIPFAPESFTKVEFLHRIAEENKLLIDLLIAEKKIIPGIYQRREDIEIKLREWVGARASIFFIVAEAGSGKTNLLVEIQKQYTELELPSLLIRAGRMEKQTLKQQISYLLNIDLEKGFENYTSIAGSQTQPTIILIDGLNEANNAEDIWKEIIELSKIFDAGCVKFVVSNRANTKADLNRYLISDKEQDLLYGEKNGNEDGIGSYSFWLSALDMKEMKGAWENYATKDKTKFKPQFNFDIIADFDRALYNQINNPLILRLFLEIYNGKSLPNKGVKHLNIWQDWLHAFTIEEQIFLKQLANEVWIKGENELLLDNLLKHETLKTYFTSDIINSPYNRLKNNGWISIYVKDLNGYIGFTVEGALLYLLALQLQEQNTIIDFAAVQAFLKSGNKLKRSAIESYLCEQALSGNLNLVADIIDVGDEYIDLSIKPLLFYLKTFGIKNTISKVLENSSDNDWLALGKLDGQLEELQLHVLRKEFLMGLMPQNELKTKAEVSLGLKAITIFDKNEAINYISKLDTNTSFILEDPDLLHQLGNCESNFGSYDKALEYYEKSLRIKLKTLGGEHPDVAKSYSNIGFIWRDKGEYDKALEFNEKCLAIRLKTLGGVHPDVASSYNNIGIIWKNKGQYDKALEFNEKSLAIRLKTLGGVHPDVASTYNNIGIIWNNKGEYDKALEYYEKCLAIELKTLGGEHPDVASSYNNIGIIRKNKGEYDNALEYYEKCLAIELKTLGGVHPSVAMSYNNIGEICRNKAEYNKALEYYEKSLAILLKTLGREHPSVALSYNNIGIIWLNKSEYDKALEYYEKSLTILLKTLGGENSDVAMSYNNIGNLWLAKGEYDKALEYYEKSLTILLKTLGGEHSDVAISYNNIGNLWLNKGDIKKALEYFEKSLELHIKIYDKKHPEVVKTYDKIAECFDSLGNGSLALDYFLQSADIRKADPKCGLGHELTIVSINNARRIAKQFNLENTLPEWIKLID
jgi:tetratricopeptide (TPR) repeat protein